MQRSAKRAAQDGPKTAAPTARRAQKTSVLRSQKNSSQHKPIRSTNLLTLDSLTLDTKQIGWHFQSSVSIVFETASPFQPKAYNIFVQPWGNTIISRGRSSISIFFLSIFFSIRSIEPRLQYALCLVKMFGWRCRGSTCKGWPYKGENVKTIKHH